MAKFFGKKWTLISFILVCVFL
ncbi:MAG: hypothetical protein H6Q44_368, partial [Deltaproteobacteria bacterium]|nr:hypothetical protein [Deltaproteobacteria bacterium]